MPNIVEGVPVLGYTPPISAGSALPIAASPGDLNQEELHQADRPVRELLDRLNRNVERLRSFWRERWSKVQLVDQFGQPVNSLNPLTTNISATAAGGSAGGIVQRQSPLSAKFGIFDDAGINPTIKNLASGSLQVSLALDNSVKLDEWLDLVLNVKGAAAFTSGGTISLWVLPSFDSGATFEDGSSSVTPARPPDDYIFLRAVGTAQVLLNWQIAIPPSQFKILLRNDSNGGQAFTNVTGDNSLVGYTHS